MDGKENLVQVTVDEYKGVGTYALGVPTNNTGTFTVDVNGGLNAIAYRASIYSNTATGTLIITEETTERVKGTFEFTGKSQTEGSKFVKGEFSLKR